MRKLSPSAAARLRSSFSSNLPVVVCCCLSIISCSPVCDCVHLWPPRPRIDHLHLTLQLRLDKHSDHYISGQAAAHHLSIRLFRVRDTGTAHSFSTSLSLLHHNTFIMGYLFYSITFLFLVSATGMLSPSIPLPSKRLTPQSSALPYQTPLDLSRPTDPIPYSPRPHTRAPLATLPIHPTTKPLRSKRLHQSGPKQFRRRH